jgi:D-alanyl-D-alanine carboxypeptidase
MLVGAVALAACHARGSAGGTSAGVSADAGASAGADASAGAGAGADADASADASATTSSLTPFGAPTAIPKYSCPVVLPGGGFRSFLSPADTKVAFVDGDDLLALVNRSPTGALPPSYAPRDLVDARDLSPRSAGECEARTCLRKEAATALHHLLDAMRLEGMQGRVESAFRGFGTQCWVFAGWASKAHAGFCEATTQSALPGHSQHQLGTTVDMFTSDWAAHGEVFRDGFGCTQGGKWLDDNAWKFGFVVSYPIDPDDRKEGSRCAVRWDHPVPIDPKTGYKNEPWHLRYLGESAASQFHAAWLASDPGSPGEITLEQWLRAMRGLAGDTELPVCDGCQCSACASMAADGERAPCGDAALQLDADGRVTAPAEEPALLDASATTESDAGAQGGGRTVVVEAKVHAPPHTPTQPPVAGDDGPAYGDGASFEALVPYPGTRPHRYADLPGAWRVAVEPLPSPHARWPWRASLAKPSLAATWNRANLVLPALAGDSVVRVRVTLPKGTSKLAVTLLRDGAEHGTRQIALDVR